MRQDLDPVDRKILRILQANGRITNADLARQVKLSPPSVLQRVRKLEELNLIVGYHADLNASALGFNLRIFAQVTLAMHQDEPLQSFVEAVREIPEVQQCHHISGEYDFLLFIEVEDMRAYEKVVREKLLKIPGLGKLHSCFVLETTKEAPGIAL